MSNQICFVVTVAAAWNEPKIKGEVMDILIHYIVIVLDLLNFTDIYSNRVFFPHEGYSDIS